MINTNPVLDVRKNRELLLETYNGINGLHQHMDAERKKLETQGWNFASAEEIWAKRQGAQELRA